MDCFGRIKGTLPDLFLILVLLLALLATSWSTLSGLMYLQSGPRLLGVPFEAFQVWQLKLIVSLQVLGQQLFEFCDCESVTFFLNCLCIASSASLIVTPFRFLADTSRPSGK